MDQLKDPQIYFAGPFEKMNTVELFKHDAALRYASLENYSAVEGTDAELLLKAELEACANKKSLKIDKIAEALDYNERAVAYFKDEIELNTAAKRKHESNLKGLKRLVAYLSTFVEGNKVTGLRYQFTVSVRKDYDVQLETDPELWEPSEQEKYLITEEITTTKQRLLRSINGDIIEDADPITTTTSKTVPNLDAICNAYQEGTKLPEGVQVKKRFSIRRAKHFSG